MNKQRQRRNIGEPMPGNRRRAIYFGVTIVACWLLSMASFYQPALAIEVEQELWGFDGRIVLDRFTPLSVLLSNPTDQPAEATLRLQKHGSGGSQKLGAALVEKVYFSPFASRWVQFYPYITSEWDQWSLTWGRRVDQAYKLQQPRPATEGAGGRASGATVALVDRDHFTADAFSVKTFPENLFPPVAAATRHLHAVLLDHAPRWQKPRRDAFLDWIHAGGRVGLLPGNDGQYPQFGNDLAVLDRPVQTQRVGSGTVVRLQRADDESINRFLRPPVARQGAEAEADAAAANEPEIVRRVEPKIFSALQQMTRPQHHWPLIHALALIYLAIIFPGWYLCARRRVDFRIMLVAFVVVALSFAVIFHTVGRRGYGETTCVNSVAIAQPLAGDSCAVMQWSNVFVTSGSAYKLSYRGSGHLYSTCQQFEQVNGVIDNGLDGSFMVDIPQFSSRNFVHHGSVPHPPVEVEIDTFRADDGKLNDLVLSIGPSFPTDRRAVHVLYRDRIYSLLNMENELRLTWAEEPIADYLKAGDKLDSQNFAGNPWNNGNKPTDPRALYRGLLPLLIARALDIRGPTAASKYLLAEDRLLLLVYAPATAPFFIDSERLGRQGGSVLYVIDLFVPEKP
jgi:hypothetical protein